MPAAPSTIVHLRGTVLERTGEYVVLDVGGVGYGVSLTAGAARALPGAGQEAQLSVHHHWTAEYGPQLYGFVDSLERRLFQTLITVKNVGPRAALSILSSVAAPELVRAIVSGDVARLSQVKGIGKKTAERLCVELRDNIAAAAAGAGKTMTMPVSAGPPLDVRIKEVVGYLEALQLRPEEYRELLPRLDAQKAVADLVRDVLAELRAKKPAG